MTKPIRIQLSRKKGWRLPPNTVVVARPTRWGNPYLIGPDGDREEVVRKFRARLASLEALQANVRAELRGKNLACWCPIGVPCHADELLVVANQKEA